MRLLMVLALAWVGEPFCSPQGRSRRLGVVRHAEEEKVLTSEDPLVVRVAAEVAEATGGASLDVRSCFSQGYDLLETGAAESCEAAEHRARTRGAPRATRRVASAA